MKEIHRLRKLGSIKIRNEGNKTVNSLIKSGRVKIVPHYNEKKRKWTIRLEKVK